MTNARGRPLPVVEVGPERIVLTDGLQPSTTYDVVLSYCNGTGWNYSSFTTSDIGPAVVVDDVDALVYSLDITSGRYYSLNDVGALIWDLLEQETTRDDLVDIVADSFDVDRTVAASDIDELIADLVDRGLVNLQP